MNIELRPNAIQDLKFFKQKHPQKLDRIFELISDIKKHAFSGIGKPEKLQYDLKGCWSRRIDKEHRLVYKVESNKIIILACRYHYSK